MPALAAARGLAELEEKLSVLSDLAALAATFRGQRAPMRCSTASWSRRPKPQPRAPPPGAVTPLPETSRALPGRARPRLVLVGAFLCTMGGTGVMLAWVLDALWILRPISTSTPIVFNTGLGFTLVGLALMLTLTGHTRILFATTAAITLLDATSLLEELLGRSLGIDQLFFDISVAAPGAVPGRIALNTSVCFLLVALALAMRAGAAGRWSAVVTGCAGGVVLALSAAALGGYAFDQSSAYRWGQFTPMSVGAAALFVLVAAELLYFTWTDVPTPAVDADLEERPARRSISAWSLRRVMALLVVVTYVPLVSMAIFGVTIASNAVTREAEGRLQAAATLEARAVENSLTGVRTRTRSLTSLPMLVAHAAGAHGVDVAAVQTALDDVVREQLGVASVGLTDAAGTLLSVSPTTPEALGKNFSFRDWYRGASTRGDVYVSEAVQSAARGRPYVTAVAAPIRSAAGSVVGYVIVGYSLAAVQEFVTGFQHRSGTMPTGVVDQRTMLLFQLRAGRAVDVTEFAYDLYAYDEAVGLRRSRCPMRARRTYPSPPDCW